MRARGRVVGDLRQRRVLDQQRRRVDPHPGRAAVEPEPQDVLVLARGRPGGPSSGRAARPRTGGGTSSPGVPSAFVVRVHVGPPKFDDPAGRRSSPSAPRPGRNQKRSRSGEPGPGGERRLEPRVPVGDVVRDDVDDRPDARARAPRRSAPRPRPASRTRDRWPGSRRRRSRRRRAARRTRGEPDGVDPEIAQVGQPRRGPRRGRRSRRRCRRRSSAGRSRR